MARVTFAFASHNLFARDDDDRKIAKNSELYIETYYLYIFSFNFIYLLTLHIYINY